MTDRRHPGRALSRRDPPDRRHRTAGEYQRQPALPCPLPVRTGTAAALPARADARPGERRDRSGSTASRSSYGKAAICKVDRFALGRTGRGQALAGWIARWSSERASRPRWRRPPAFPIAAPRCSRPGRRSRAGLEPIPGHPRGRAADHPGRPRRQRRRPGRRGALHGALDPCRPLRSCGSPRNAPAPISTTSCCRRWRHE